MHVPGVCGLMRRRSRPCRPRATAGAVTNARGILGETGAAERAAGAWNGGFTGMKKLLIGLGVVVVLLVAAAIVISLIPLDRSEEHTSELQSLMRSSYAVFCLKKK